MSAARIVFWTGAAWVFYVYVGYPALLAVVSLIWRVRPVAGDCEPFVSVVIAARNEERDIKWKIFETLNWDYPVDKLEIVVASDASSDSTDTILASITDPRLRWIRVEPRGGKVRALNKLVTMSRGSILFFTDANAHIPARCLREMVRHFADPRVGCVTGDSYAMAKDTSIASGAGAYWSYEKIIKHFESRMGSVVACDGAIFCLRRELYTSCHPELANDLELPLTVAERGYWVLHEPNAKVFERDTSSVLEEFRRRRRVCSQGMRAMWTLRETLHGLRLWEFASHKLLRWWTLLPMMMLLGGSVMLRADGFYAAVLGVQIVFYGASAVAFTQTAVGKAPLRAFSIPFYVVLGAAGALSGVLEALIGRKFILWEIPALSRGAGKSP